MLIELSGQVYLIYTPEYRVCLPGRNMPMSKGDVFVKVYCVAVMEQ